MKKTLFVVCVSLIVLGGFVFFKENNDWTRDIFSKSGQNVYSSDASKGAVSVETNDKSEVINKDVKGRKNDLNLLPETEEMDLVKIERQAKLNKWASGHFYRTDPKNWNEGEIRNAIENVPVEIYTEDLTPEDIEAAKDMMFKYVQCYSSGRFDDWLSFRGGRDALATLEESEYMRKIFQFGLERWEHDLPDLPKPKTLLEMIEATWNRALNYSRGAIDEVSFDMSFIAFYKETKDTFDSRCWQPEPDEPHALEKAARSRGSLRRGWKGRTIENKVTPQQVMERNGEIKYFDFLVTVRREKGMSVPVMLRYYYDPGAKKWLVAYGTIFLAEEKTSGLEPLI